MKTSSTKLIATLAIVAFTLTAADALAKGGNNNGGNRSFTSHMNSSNVSSKFNTSKFNSTTFKLNNNHKNSSNHSNISTLSSKKVDLSQVFKKQANNNTSLKNISLNNKNLTKINTLVDNKKFDKKIDFFSKDKNFCKKGKCFDWCNPWYFGCYPSYGCYTSCCDYCSPTYTCSYSTVPVVPVVEPTRVRVVLGSVIMLNGQSFGGQPGGVRLRLSGMALPIQVVEWTPNAVKAQLPQIELTGLTLADIEVVRPDGSLASTTPVELAVPQPLAFNR